jgi:hypothetical protein
MYFNKNAILSEPTRPKRIAATLTLCNGDSEGAQPSKYTLHTISQLSIIDKACLLRFNDDNIYHGQAPAGIK